MTKSIAESIGKVSRVWGSDALASSTCISIEGGFKSGGDISGGGGTDACSGEFELSIDTVSISTISTWAEETLSSGVEVSCGIDGDRASESS